MSESLYCEVGTDGKDHLPASARLWCRIFHDWKYTFDGRSGQRNICSKCYMYYPSGELRKVARGLGLPLVGNKEK